MTRSKSIPSIDSISRTDEHPDRDRNTPSPDTSAEIASKLGFNTHVHRGIQCPDGKVIKSHVVEIFGWKLSQVSRQLVS